ncbi:MAG: tetratricopeptide repeat protein [Candidatus Cloacimonetes bacterium]|nr:tetratricopeptide repeat protein [Candidatus Cloacimonadota bacterium]
MKKSLLIILVALFSFGWLNALEMSLDQINNEAIQAYQNKDYDTALEKFLIVDNNGIINANLYYNIANCYFRQGSLGLSILYYEKCLKMKPDHAAARKNRDFALTLTRDKIDQEEPSALEKLLTKLYNSFDLNSVALLDIILFALLILLLIIMNTLFRQRDKSLPVFLIFLVLILLTCSATVSYLKYTSFHDTKDAVIIAATAIGYSGPGEEYTRVFTIHEGMTCRVEDANDNWLLIKLPNGIGGWVEENLLQRVTF